VRDGYVAVGGGFGDINNFPEIQPNALVAQVDSAGTIFAVGNYEFTPSGFSGTLDADASDITVVDAAKTDSDYINEFTITDFDPEYDLTSDLIGTLYYGNVGDDDRLVNGAYSVSIDDTGAVTMETGRGTVLFGNTPEQCVPTQSSHFHIMRDDPTTVDLFFGDDFNYVKLPYDSTLTNVGVQIGTDATNLWSFGKNGTLTFPSGNMIIGNAFGGDGIVGSTNTTVGVIAQGQNGAVGIQWIDNIENIGSTTTQLQVAGIAVNGPLASTTGTVQIVTGFSSGTTVSNTWEFGVDGGLTFPDSTVQTTAYKSTSGSWTLATGANTVSITVPLNGNYQMWVNGNVPNGIVEWNATVNVSNPNVPAIGSQYAWYYYAGNALVLTAIPDQIVGTVGVISTSSSYVGNTANVFTFGITNNSTSTQVINWGYTTL
jgi:hypothetical protein